jgi:hypothetical protein
MSSKYEIIDRLMRLSSWALETAFAIEDDESAGIADLDACVGAIDESLFPWLTGGQKALDAQAAFWHHAPDRVQ